MNRSPVRRHSTLRDFSRLADHCLTTSARSRERSAGDVPPHTPPKPPRFTFQLAVEFGLVGAVHRQNADSILRIRHDESIRSGTGGIWCKAPYRWLPGRIRLLAANTAAAAF